MKPGIRSVSVEDLLGRRLNDIEEKYAPDTLHIGGPMAAPLPIPRVSVIGTRAPSTAASSTPDRSQDSWQRTVQS